MRVRAGRLEGRPALAEHVDAPEAPSCFVLLAFEDREVTTIRDDRYLEACPG